MKLVGSVSRDQSRGGAVVATRRFEDLYRTHGGEAVRFGYLLTGDRAQAEDLAQEAFVRLLGRFGDLRNPEAFRAYLLRTVGNLARNHFRRRRIERERVRPEVSSFSVEPLIPDDPLWVGLGRLPYRQRIALVLRYCHDLSEQQTADVMQISPKAVKSLVGRGLAAMRSNEEVMDR